MPAPLSDAAQEAKRERILEAARRVCQRSDLDSAKMADIAAEARVSKGTLYRFFQSKEDLLLEMVRTTQGEYSVAVETALAVPEVEEKLRRFIDLVVARVPTSQEANRIAFQALGFAARDELASARLHSIYLENYGRRSRALVEAFRQSQAAGLFRSDLDPETCIAALVAVTDGLQWRCSFESRACEEAWLRGVLDEVIQRWKPLPS